MSAGAAAAFVVAVIVFPIALNEAGELAPWMAERVVRLGAAFLGSAEARQRYSEEWLANLNLVPGKITKLGWAFGLIAWSVPRLRWQIRVRQRTALISASKLVEGRSAGWVLGRAKRYEARYRNYVLASLRFVDHTGLSTVGPRSSECAEVLLDVSFVPSAKPPLDCGILSDPPVSSTRRQSISEVLDRRPSQALALIGSPGTGKTTLLRYIARDAALRSRGRGRTLPIALELRSHVEQIIGDPDTTLPQLLRRVVFSLSANEPSGWWERQLRRGACLVLLDGLDEVLSTESRRVVADWIERQVVAYPRNTYVVTSRPLGYQSAAIAPAVVLHTQPFTDEQVERFLRSWYRAAERGETGATDQLADSRAAAQAEDLLKQLAGRPELRHLTVSPLLLSMIANVHRYRGALPGSTAALYHEICQVVLWLRPEGKRLAAIWPGQIMELVLAELAYDMMSRRVVRLPADQVLDIICRSLLQASPTSSTANDFLADVCASGLLVEREMGWLAFAHLAFQEYMAATHIRDTGLAAVLADAVDDLWWHETTLLYAASGGADRIVRACLASGSPIALSLALSCAEGASDLSRDLYDALGIAPGL